MCVTKASKYDLKTRITRVFFRRTKIPKYKI